MGCLKSRPREEILAEAEHKFKEILEKEPENEDAQYNLAITYYNLGKYDLTREIYLKINENFKEAKSSKVNSSFVSSQHKNQKNGTANGNGVDHHERENHDAIHYNDEFDERRQNMNVNIEIVMNDDDEDENENELDEDNIEVIEDIEGIQYGKISHRSTKKSNKDNALKTNRSNKSKGSNKSKHSNKKNDEEEVDLENPKSSQNKFLSGEINDNFNNKRNDNNIENSNHITDNINDNKNDINISLNNSLNNSKLQQNIIVNENTDYSNHITDNINDNQVYQDRL